jgi:predicted SAM-dependent methyltransferase
MWDILVWTGDSLKLVFSRSCEAECDCCGWGGNRFFLQTYITGEKVHTAREMCPKCLSLGRQRQLVRHLRDRTPLSSLNSPTILDIGPSRVEVKWFQEQGYDIISVDLMPGIATIQMDITRCAFKDSVFDVIACSHVLEHVRDDMMAMKEILRILKKGGICIVQVPLQPDLLTTIEYQRPNPDEFDHIRAYGLDFASRLEAAGFKVVYANNELFEVTKPKPALNTS